MQKTLVAVSSVLFALAVSSEAAPTGRVCGAPSLSAEQKRSVDAATTAHLMSADVSAARAVGSVTIPVWFHVVSQGSGLTSGDVPQSMLDQQVRVLNDSYSGATGGSNSAFRFALAGVKRRTDPTLFVNCQSDRCAMTLPSLTSTLSRTARTTKPLKSFLSV